MGIAKPLNPPTFLNPPVNFGHCTLKEKEIRRVLFDSYNNNWKRDDCQFLDKILYKSNILILINDSKEKFGYFIPNQINKIGKYVESDNCFIYSFNYQETYTIKDRRYSICIHNDNDDKLLTIGKEDIILYKQEKKNKSYCKQTSFDYGKEKNVLVGKEGKNNPFDPKRIVIFQLE